jgi:acyl carrier protein
LSNVAKLQAAFVEALGLPTTVEFETLTYQGSAEWDSIAHMQLIAELESVFDVMLSTEDVIAMGSFPKAREILARSGVDFGA